MSVIFRIWSIVFCVTRGSFGVLVSLVFVFVFAGREVCATDFQSIRVGVPLPTGFGIVLCSSKDFPRTPLYASRAQ